MVDIEKIGLAFLKALYINDFDTVRDLLSLDAIFEDPTSPSGFVVPQYLEGKDAYLEFWETSGPQLDKKLNIASSFASAGRVVLNIEITGTGPASVFGIEGNKVSFKARGITVLHIREGLIVRHSDFIDYKKVQSSLRILK